MAKVSIEESTLTDIADAIRAKYGAEEQIPVSAMGTIISNIPSGGEGLPSDMIVGEFIPQTDIEQYSVSIDKGIIPVFAVCFATNAVTNTKAYCQIMSLGLRRSTTIKQAMTYNSYQGSATDFATNYTAVTMDDEQVTFKSRGSSYTFKTGVNYKYIIVFQEN